MHHWPIHGLMLLMHSVSSISENNQDEVLPEETTNEIQNEENELQNSSNETLPSLFVSKRAIIFCITSGLA